MNNEKAFPHTNKYGSDDEGMGLHHYFAAKAMQAQMTRGIHEDDFVEVAARSYKMANEMVKAGEVRLTKEDVQSMREDAERRYRYLGKMMEAREA